MSKSTHSVRAERINVAFGLIQKLRQHAQLRGLTLSELVGQALEAFLHPGRGRG